MVRRVGEYDGSSSTKGIECNYGAAAAWQRYAQNEWENTNSHDDLLHVGVIPR